MWFLLVLFYVSTITVPTFGFLIQNGGSLCPPPEEVAPCTCSEVSDRVTALCKGISNARTIEKVFSKNPDWNLQDVHFDQCVLDYIPSSIVKSARFQTLNVTSSTLVSLFDAAPVKTPEINVYLYDVKILRGVQWEFFSNATLKEFGAWNVDIEHFGTSFKEHMPQVVTNLWFDNTKTASISHQAFQHMVNVEMFTLVGGSLKKISRDMFPRPWKVLSWDLR
ncbi:hypothetical protein AVEN_103887-1 [Araneus ventricosus]|uniref:Uncharacterized protein n=1 Tax=Araneus ventricosus TaxID=182803 RepID=A0A4Y2K5J7_ARAVE|nr:hypothetical protein AVEN_103887-1 [Araneus ventricosus]